MCASTTGTPPGPLLLPAGIPAQPAPELLPEPDVPLLLPVEVGPRCRCPSSPTAGRSPGLRLPRCHRARSPPGTPNKTPGDVGENRSHQHGRAVFLARRGGERTIRGSRFDLLPCRLAGTGSECDLFPCRLAGTGSESDRFPSPLPGTESEWDRFPSPLPGTESVWDRFPSPLPGTGRPSDLFPFRLPGTVRLADRFPSRLPGTGSVWDRFPSRLPGTGIW